MSKLVRVRPSLIALSLALPFLMGGCEEAKKAQEAACCKDFQVGADMSQVDWGVDASVKGQYSAFIQAVSDLSAVAAASLGDVTAACQAMAVDMGADPKDASLTGKTGAGLATAWCALAKAQIDAKFGASGTLAGKISIDLVPPKCEASFEAKAKCEASCSASAECDFNVNPPKCEGGTLSVECAGSCSGSASAAIECTGSCKGQCSGTCQASATAPVQCQGQCEGTCSARDANGDCNGTCSGTCTMNSGVTASCSGTCQGTCDAACEATGSVKARCSGTCSGQISAPRCEGGSMSGGCTASAECSGSCSGSAEAKANCTPPAITLSFTANATLSAEQQAQLAIAVESIKVNLPKLLLVVQARAQTFATSITTVGGIGGTLAASGKLGVKGTSCGVIAASTIAAASTNFTTALSASTSVVGSFTLPS